MKRPSPERSNNHVIHMAVRVLSLPFVIVVAVIAWVKARLQALKSDETRYDEDQVRQQRVRRELRGLPPDHVQRPAASADAKPAATPTDAAA